MGRLFLFLLFAASLIFAPAFGAEYGNPQFLVETSWLAQHLGDRDLRIVDMSGDPKDYEKGHIPGAIHVSVNRIRLLVKEGGFRLPDETESRKLLSELGIDRKTRVILYDDAGGLHASRLFFTLDVLGHERIALLNGGIKKWRAEGRPVSKETHRVAPREYVGVPHRERVATAEWILSHLKDPGVVLVDNRSRKEFTGEARFSKRGGHIPGARHIEWTKGLQPDGRFKTADDLRALFQAEGVTPDKTAVTYCQVHHRGSHGYFVLRLLGYPVRGYDRSWAEWGNRDDLPIER